MDWRKKGANFDTAWARRPAAVLAREVILMYGLGSLIGFYTRPRVVGLDVFDGVKPPAIFVANHSSHLDTPSVLRSLPKKWRRKTATVAAADYFYKNRFIASLVTLSFATVPIDRKGGLSKSTKARLARLVADKWNILLYPEGTRSRDGRMASFKSGAGYLSVEHQLPIVPISLRGTFDAMPVGKPWPRRFPVTITFGPAVYPAPGEDHRAMTDRVERALREMRGEPPPA
ncbi:MAG: lysophospholipid acyltransferase family protein [Actinomycetota bacterium]